ncbi:MAG TPA: PQQ-binding-like beta-propeller repeat protein, partial [Gemmata sp.]|nr:PQQ-binding-like beta-propeller repeat protein [Gemmata sp.]
MTRHLGLLAVVLAAPATTRGADPKDWPSYNGAANGWRFNASEKMLGPKNVGRLEEKWRFPAKGSDLKIGAVQATPIVVEGHVYFGTVNKPAVYALTPDGRLKWSYTLPTRTSGGGLTYDRSVSGAKGGKGEKEESGVYGSALVTPDAVYFADLAGVLFALDCRTGKEKWTVDTRGKEFPGAHPLNGTFASPILADGKVIFAGGAFEQW